MESDFKVGFFFFKFLMKFFPVPVFFSRTGSNKLYNNIVFSKLVQSLVGGLIRPAICVKMVISTSLVICSGRNIFLYSFLIHMCICI